MGDGKITLRGSLYLHNVILDSTQTCEDPAWMKSNTYYPPGTVCAVDESARRDSPVLSKCRQFISGNNMLQNHRNYSGHKIYFITVIQSLPPGKRPDVITFGTLSQPKRTFSSNWILEVIIWCTEKIVFYLSPLRNQKIKDIFAILFL
jgi:hypothetical protein